MTSLAIAMTLAAVAYHPESLSSSRITIDGPQARAIIRCQVLSLSEVLPGLDLDGDALVTESEISLGHDRILEYITDHYRLLTGTDREAEGGVELHARDGLVRWVGDDAGDLLSHRDGMVDIELTFDHTEPITDLVVDMTLFADTSPDHVDLTTIDWGDDGLDTFGLDAHAPRERSDPTGRGAFFAFLNLGVRHILGGWDHLAFLGILILASRRFRSLLAVITGFTIAHSVTLAITALGLIDVSRFATTIELAIALSIVYVAIDTLLAPRLTRPRWIEALLFGLLHGLGFATFLGQSLVHEPHRLVPLASFNLGVEAGQIGVAAAIVIVIRLLPRRPDDTDFLAPRWLRISGAVAIAGLGSWWVVERLV